MPETNPATASPTATASVDLSVPCEEVYAIVSDLAEMAAIAEETETMTWLGDASAARVGARFKGENSNGTKSWSTTCTVVEATAGPDGAAFAFDVDVLARRVPIARWRYELVPSETGCTVVESTWDRRPRWFLKIGTMATGVADRPGANLRHIEATLQRLKARAERD